MLTPSFFIGLSSTSLALHWLMDRWVGGSINRQTDRQTDRQTERRRQTGRDGRNDELQVVAEYQPPSPSSHYPHRYLAVALLQVSVIFFFINLIHILLTLSPSVSGSCLATGGRQHHLLLHDELKKCQILLGLPLHLPSSSSSTVCKILQGLTLL